MTQTRIVADKIREDRRQSALSALSAFHQPVHRCEKRF